MINVQEKKEDFIRFSFSAFENKELNKNEEAAIQARKAGEVYMKIILTLKSKQGRNLKFNDRTGYKELVALLKENSFVTNQDVNLLESIQMIGNKASHDAKIVQADTEYAINALKILVHNLFKDKLDEKVPPRLIKYLENNSGTQHLSDRVISLQKEIKKLRREAGTNLPEEKEKNNNQDSFHSDIKEKILALEDKLRLLESEKTEVVEITIPTKVESGSNGDLLHKESKTDDSKKKNKRIIFVLSPVIVLASVLFYLLFINKSGELETNSDNKRVVQKDSLDKKLSIGIIPLEVIRDNKVVKLNFEKNILIYLKEISKENNWDIDFRIIDFHGSYHLDSIKKFIPSEKLDLLIYGDVIEDENGDSAQVTLKYVYSFWSGKRFFTGKYDQLGISLGNPEGMQFFKKETSILAAFGLAVKNHFSGKDKEALQILDGLYTASSTLRMTIYDLRYECYKAKQDVVNADKLVSEYISAFPDSVNAYIIQVEILDWKNLPDGQKMDSVLKIAEEKKPNSAYVWHWKGRSEVKYVGQTEKAKKYFEKSLELDSSIYETWKYLAYLGVNIDGDFERAKERAHKMIQLDSLRYDGYQLLGDLAYQSQQFPESIKWHKRAVETSNLPDFIKVELYMQIAANYYQLFLLDKKYGKECLLYFDKGIKLSSGKQKAEHLVGKSTIMVRMGDTIQAEKLLLKAIKLNPNYEIAYENLVLIAESWKNYKNVLKYSKEIYRLNPKSTMAMVKMGTHYLLDDTDKSNDVEGFNYLNKVLASDKKNLESWMVKAQYFHYKNSIPDSAKLVFENILKINPDNLFALNGLAEIYANNHKYQRALIYAEKALKINPNFASANMTAGVCYTAMSTPQSLVKAFNHIDKVLQLQPNNSVAHFVMCQVFINGRNYPEAKKYYDKAIMFNSKLKDESIEAIINTK